MSKPWERDWPVRREHQPKVIDLSAYLRGMRRLRGKMEVPPPNFVTEESPDIEGPLLQPDEQEANGGADSDPEA